MENYVEQFWKIIIIINISANMIWHSASHTMENTYAALKYLSFFKLPSAIGSSLKIKKKRMKFWGKKIQQQLEDVKISLHKYLNMIVEDI